MFVKYFPPYNSIW